MTHSVTASLVWAGDRFVFLDERAYRAGVQALRPQPSEAFELRVERLQAARTSKQNAAYWGYIVTPVSLATQTSKADIHRIFKAEMLPREHFVLADVVTGDVKLETDIAQHTTVRLSEQEFDDYMEHCRAFAMDTIGIDMSERGLWERFGIMRR